MPGTIISIINFKGGVGKTTLAVNLATCLAHTFKKKALLVDLDAQTSATMWLLQPHDWEAIANGTYHWNTTDQLFTHRLSASAFCKPFEHDSLGSPLLPLFSFLPASYRMIQLETKIAAFRQIKFAKGEYRRGLEYRFIGRHRNWLKSLFDFVIFDCPPSLYHTTRNALAASDHVLIPAIPDTLSLQGFHSLIHHIDTFIKRELPPRVLGVPPSLLGVVLNKVSSVNEHERGQILITQHLEMEKARGGILVQPQSRVFTDYPIRQRVVHAEAVAMHKPLCLHQPDQSPYQDIMAVTQAIVDAISQEGGPNGHIR
jgi:chromosome partitioning protein